MMRGFLSILRDNLMEGKSSTTGDRDMGAIGDVY
jgi:hypothetical protein